MNTNTSWVNKYMRIPFEADGASFKGCNCWGLVHLVLVTERGIDTPRYSEISAKHVRRITLEVNSAQGIPPWEHRVAVGGEEPFDVIVFKGIVRGHAVNLHTGIVTKPGYCLHIAEGHQVAHVPFRDSEWSKCNFTLLNRLVGIFRHEQLLAVAA